LAVESLLQTNPGAKITIHFENPPDNADWKALQVKVEFKPIDMQNLLAGLPASMALVVPVLQGISTSYLAGRSNILRYLILFKEGGIYLDFDTITIRDFKPLLSHSAFIGEEAVFRYDDDRVSGKFKLAILPTGLLFGLSYFLSLWNCRLLGDSAWLNTLNKWLMRGWSDKKLNNAVLGCEVASPFFARAIALIPDTNPGVKYALGPILMNRTWDMNPGKDMQRLDSSHFYAIPPSQTFRFFYGPASTLPQSTLVVHWCSSNHKKLAATLTRENLGKVPISPTLFHKLAYTVLSRGI
jgi:hypothetical protein